MRGCLHYLVRRQTEGAAVGQLHDVDGEALVSGLITEAELHLGAAERPLLVGVEEEVRREAGPGQHKPTPVSSQIFILRHSVMLMR